LVVAELLLFSSPKSLITVVTENGMDRSCLPACSGATVVYAEGGHNAFIAHHLFVIDSRKLLSWMLLVTSGESGRSLFFIVFSFKSQSFNRAEVNFNLRIFGFQFDARSG
jgi:hypothetical protein